MYFNSDKSIQHSKLILEKKNGEVENEIPDISGLMNASVPNTKIGEVESKIPDVSDLAKETVYNTKISTMKGKYFDNNKFTSDILDTKIKQKELVKKPISNIVKVFDLNLKH